MNYYLPATIAAKYLYLEMHKGGQLTVRAKRSPQDNEDFARIEYRDVYQKTERVDSSPNGIRYREVFFGSNRFPAFRSVRHIGWIQRSLGPDKIGEKVKKAL